MEAWSELREHQTSQIVCLLVTEPNPLSTEAKAPLWVRDSESLSLHGHFSVWPRGCNLIFSCVVLLISPSTFLHHSERRAEWVEMKSYFLPSRLHRAKPKHWRVTCSPSLCSRAQLLFHSKNNQRIDLLLLPVWLWFHDWVFFFLFSFGHAKHHCEWLR